MSSILILSENDVFKNDLIDQMKHHAAELSVVDEDVDAADIVVVDEDISLLETKVKKDLKAPVILLTNNENFESQKIHHIIAKPFVLSFFLDDVKASISLFENSAEGALEFNQYILYPARKEILNHRNDEITKLTEKEVAIIKYLYRNKEQIVGKSDLMQEVWGYAADVATHTVETHIYRLRQKVEQDDLSAQLILTSDGGYQLIV